MSGLQPPRGTHDIFGEQMARHAHVEETARAVAGRHGFAPIAAPIFEFIDVFKRTLGETSDVVSKEMFSFRREDEQFCLRPEATAGLARAYLSNGMAQQAPCKFYCSGPMFRAERPQKGRYRQFHQIDVEIIGVPGPQADIEVIACGAMILEELGVLDRTTLELNTLGDAESRAAYRAALVDYFSAHKSGLSEDSLTRLERNPLRILDSKDEGDRAIVKDAPIFTNYLNDASQEFFAAVRAGLETLGIAYEISPRLVRGLDYYCHTAFEFVTTELGAQGTVMGGGRYDGLIEMLGGPPTPGIGWAGGIERLAMMLEEQPAAPRPIAVIPIGQACEETALTLTQALRRAGLSVELGYSGNLNKRMKRANRQNARAAVLIGEDELAKGVATVRDLDSGDQQELSLDAVEAALRTLS